MRVILKQGGVVVLLGALGVLTVATVISQRGRGDAAPPPVTAVVSPSSGGTLKAAPRQGASVMASDSMRHWSFYNPSTVARSTKTTDPALPAGDRDVFHAEVLKPNPSQFWTIQTGQVIPSSIPQGHTLVVRFWGRSKTANTIHVAFEQVAAPFSKDLEAELKLTPEWKEYLYTFTTKQAYSSNASALHLLVGYDAGEIDFAGVELHDLTAAK